MAALRRFAPLYLVAALAAPPAATAAVTTYTGSFSGTIAAGDTALLNNGASVSGNVANSGTLQFNMSGTSAVADNAIISGTGLVRMTGSGTVSNLFDPQTYTGATRLENGTLLINYNDRLGNLSSGVTFDGGRLQITNSGVTSTFSTARAMSLVSAGTIDTSSLADGSYDQPAFTGPVSGTGTLTLAAHGLGDGSTDAYLRFSGASTYSGTTRITSGVVYASSTTAFGSSTVVLDGGGLVAPSAVTVNNAIVLAGTANSVRSWTSQTMNLGGVISGTGGLQKTDNGTVNLNAANTYTGATRILDGTLNASNYAALAGTTLDMQAGDNGSIGFTVAQTGTYQIGGLTGSRNLANGGDTLAIGGNGTSTTYSGALSGTGGLIKAGAGTLTLTGSNAYTGGTVFQAGTLALGSANAIGSSGTLSFTGGTLQYSASNTTDYSSRFSTAAGQDYAVDTNGQTITFAAQLQSVGGSLTKLGAGVLNLTGTTAAPNTVVLDLTTNVSAGGLQASSGTAALRIGNSGTGTLNVTGGNVTNLASFLGYNAGSVGTATVSSGTWANSGNLTVGVSGTGTLTMSGGLVTVGGQFSRGSNGTINLNAGGTLQIGTGGTTGVLATNLANNGTLVFNRSDNVTMSRAITGSGSVVQRGPGVLTLAGTAARSGGTTLQAGTLLIGSVNAIAIGSGTLTLNGGVLGTTNTWRGVLPNAVTLGGDITFNNPLSSPGEHGAVYFNGPTDLGGGQRVLTTQTISPSFSGPVTNGGLTKDGYNSVYLTASNSYTGPTVVKAGMLYLNIFGDISSSSGVDLASGAYFALLSSVTGDRTLQMLTGSAGSIVSVGSKTLTVGNAASGTFAGGIRGTGGLTKAGSGSLTLSGSNSFTGQTTVSAGTLILNSGNALAPTAAVVVNAGATLEANQPIRVGYLDSAGTVVGGGNLTATLTVTRSGNIGGIANGTDGQGTFAAGIAKLGAGTSTVNSANTYTGLTWVREGTLAMGLANAFAAESDLTVDAGATFDRAGFAQTVTNAVINGSVANTGGGGLLTVTGTLSGSGVVNGNVTVAGVHAPGNSPGLQTITGDLAYLAAAAVAWELTTNGTSGAGTNFDQIVLPTGNLVFSGSTMLDLSFDGAGSVVDWSDSFWDSDRDWTVFDLGGGTTTGFGDLALGGSLLDSLGQTLLSTRGTFSTSLSGQNVLLNYTVAVPEPTTWALALAGLACGGRLLRRRRRA